MIAGIAILVTLIFIRFQDPGSEANFPKFISLPEGIVPVAFTQTAEWYAIVTSKDQILIFNTNGELFQEIIVKIETKD